MKKIIKHVFVLALVAGVAAGVTYAWFGGSVKVEGVTAKTGDIKLTAGIHNGEINTPIVDKWLPGQPASFQFKVTNNGDGPVNLKGYAKGQWQDVANPDANLVKATAVYYWDDEKGDWEKIVALDSGLTGEFNYQKEGESTLLVLPVGQTEHFKIDVKLDEMAGNAYKNKTYKADVHIMGVQAGGTFPAETY